MYSSLTWVRGGSTEPNLLYIRESEVCRVLSNKFGVVQAHRTSLNLLKTHDIRESEVCRALSHKFGVVQAHRTSSNYLKTHDIRESEVCRVLSYKFGVVQAHRTSSNLLKTHDIRESEVCRVNRYCTLLFKWILCMLGPYQHHHVRIDTIQGL